MKILDACCGSRMFWFDEEHKDALYMDNRVLSETLCDGRQLEINPDMKGDFRNMPFPDDSFYMVVFDPPHLIKAGQGSWLAKKYGLLGPEWRKDIAQGFRECMRVLRPNGTLIFKWNEDQIALPEILKVIDFKPLFGQKRSKTQFLVFMKEDTNAE